MPIFRGGKLLIYALTFLFCSSLFSYADENLETIEVRAEKEVTPFTFGSSTVINQEQIRSSSLPQLSEVLRKDPTIVTTQSGGPGSQTSFFIRGSESRHISFTLDNLKLNDPSNIGRQFDSAFLDTNFIQEIRVHRGPQAVMFGSDAMGGQVEMISRKGRDAPHGRVNFLGGSFGTYGSSLTQDWKGKLHQGTVSVSRTHSDGISRLNKKRFHATERDGYDATQASSSSSHYWHEQKKVRTDLLFTYVHGKNELDGSSHDNHHDISLNDQYLIQQKTNWQKNKTTLFSLRNGLNRNQRFTNTLSSGVTSFDGNLNQNEFIMRKDTDKYSLVSGLAHEKEQAHFQHFERSFDLAGVYSQGLLRMGALEWQGGLRLEKHTRYGNFATGATGLRYTKNKNQFSYQYGRGYKAPSLYQLYAPDLFGTPIGNSNLHPESNHSQELRWQRKGETVDLTAALFRNQMENLITFSNTGYLNQGRFIVQGLEISSSIHQDSWLLQLNATHQDFSHEKTTIIRRPKNFAQASLSWFPVEDTELFTRLKWFSSRKDLDLNSNVVKLNSYRTVDLGARKTFQKHEFSLQVLNVLNKEYEEVFGYSVLPRSLFGSYAYNY
jgi:vitamin B12 transporter